METACYLDLMYQVNNMNYRIGQSKDIHRLENNSRPLIIGGVKFPFNKGPVSHSDGDVLYHAVAEALLGALSLGDLGTFFPDDNDTYLNMDSSKIVKASYDMVKRKGYEINNIDTCVICEQPKLKNHILTMRNNIASLLETSVDNVSVKAQTNEKCGEVGRQEAIEATCVVLLRKKM